MWTDHGSLVLRQTGLPPRSGIDLPLQRSRSKQTADMGHLLSNHADGQSNPNAGGYMYLLGGHEIQDGANTDLTYLEDPPQNAILNWLMPRAT